MGYSGMILNEAGGRIHGDEDIPGRHDKVDAAKNQKHFKQ